MKTSILRRLKRLTLFDAVLYLVMTVIMAVMLYPFLFTFAMSTSTVDQLVNVTFFPIGFNLSAYEFIFKMPNVLSGYANSLLYTATFTVLSDIMIILCAYPLSKKWLPGRSAVTVYIVITMFVGGGLIPNYILVTNYLQWMDTWMAIVVPVLISTWLVIITRTFFMGIPVELDESAYVDGAGEFTILTRIYLPLSKPVIATITLNNVVGMWNQWFHASIYLNSKAKYPIQLILRNLLATQKIEMEDMSAALMTLPRIDARLLTNALTIAVALPIILIYPFMQKYFVKGMLIGSLKG